MFFYQFGNNLLGKSAHQRVRNIIVPKKPELYGCRSKKVEVKLFLRITFLLRIFIVFFFIFFNFHLES